MSHTFNMPFGVEEVGIWMKHSSGDVGFKGPLVRSAQQRFFGVLEEEYGFSKAICRSLVDLAWGFMEETYGDRLQEGQISFVAVAAEEPPGKAVKDLRTVQVNLTVHNQGDIEVLNREGIAALRQHKIIRMANEARGQSALLTQADLAVLTCCCIRTIRRDIKALQKRGIEVPTRGTVKDIGPGVSHKTRIVELWLTGYEYTDIERRTGHSGEAIQRYLEGFSRVVRLSNRYSVAEIRELTGISERVIKEYQTLHTKYRDRVECRDRLSQILNTKKGGIAPSKLESKRGSSGMEVRL